MKLPSKRQRRRRVRVIRRRRRHFTTETTGVFATPHGTIVVHEIPTGVIPHEEEEHAVPDAE